jgi:predicted nucleic acid-binding protein
VSGFLLDTNVISELIKARPAPKVVHWVDSVDEGLLFLSVLTLGEIEKGIAALGATSRRRRLETWVEAELRPRFADRILAVDEGVARRWGRLAGDREAQGEGVLPVIDGLLAATALVHELVLVTRNSKDFAATGVAVLNPWEDLSS